MVIEAQKFGSVPWVTDPAEVAPLLRSTREPWLFGAPQRAVEGALQEPWVHSISAVNCKRWEGFYDKIAFALDFPSYFGRNLDAVVDCLRDLRYDQRGPTALVIAEADDLLDREPARDVTSLLGALEETACELNSDHPDWADDGPPVPFHCVLVP